jgi:hypothetical protein
MQTQVQSQVTSSKIHGQSDTIAGFSQSTSVFLCVIIILPLLNTCLPLPHNVCDNTNKAAHYHTLGLKLGASSLTWHLASLRENVFYFNVNKESENKSEVK